MDTIQHDPRTKQLIKNTICNFLYVPVTKHMANQLQSLVIKNTLLGKYSHKSFYYKEILYNVDTSPTPLRRNKLVPELKEKMDTLLREKQDLQEKEYPFVLGFITKVLNSSLCFDDYLKVFPEAIHPPLQSLAASCPCKTSTLSQEQVNELLEAHKETIQMIKSRMVTNLLI